MQVSRAGVITETGPSLEHIIERRRRQRADVVPARQKAGVIGRHGLDRGLLQHDFGEPDAGTDRRVGRAARATAACGDGGRTRPIERWVAGMTPASGACRAVAPRAWLLRSLSWVRPRDDRAPHHEQALPLLRQAAARPRRQSDGRNLPQAGLCLGRIGDALDRDRRRRHCRAQRADQNPVAFARPTARSANPAL